MLKFRCQQIGTFPDKRMNGEILNDLLLLDEVQVLSQMVQPGMEGHLWILTRQICHLPGCKLLTPGHHVRPGGDLDG